MVSILISKFITVYFLINMVIFIFIVIAPLPVCSSWLWLVVFTNDYFQFKLI